MFNSITIVGRLGGAPDPGKTASGADYARFSVATTESFKDARGDWTDRVTWHRVAVWNATAGYAVRNLQKGDLVVVRGKLENYRYTGSDGVERESTQIVARKLRRLPRPAPANASPSRAEFEIDDANVAPVRREEDERPF